MDAFEELYRKYYPRIYTFLLKMCADSPLAEELTQETFYQAYLSIHRFKGNSGIFTWLASIAKHVYYQYLRKNKLELESVSLSLIAEMGGDMSGGETPEEEYERRAKISALNRSIEGIPAKYRDVMVLRLFAEMTYAQIGEALGITENSAKVIFFRAKKMLMEELENENYV